MCFIFKCIIYKVVNAAYLPDTPHNPKLKNLVRRNHYFMLKNAGDGINRANKFVNEVIETNQVFHILHPKGGLWLSESNEHFDLEGNPLDIIPVWSKKYLAYARAYAKDLEIKDISLDEFCQRLLPAMIQDNILLGVNWDNQGFGQEIKADEMLL